MLDSTHTLWQIENLVNCSEACAIVCDVWGPMDSPLQYKDSIFLTKTQRLQIVATTTKMLLTHHNKSARYLNVFISASETRRPKTRCEGDGWRPAVKSKVPTHAQELMTATEGRAIGQPTKCHGRTRQEPRLGKKSGQVQVGLALGVPFKRNY